MQGTADIREYLYQNKIQLQADNRTINYLYRRKKLHETKRKRRRKRRLIQSQDITDSFRLHKRKKIRIENTTIQGSYTP